MRKFTGIILLSVFFTFFAAPAFADEALREWIGSKVDIELGLSSTTKRINDAELVNVSEYGIFIKHSGSSVFVYDHAIVCIVKK